MGKGARRKAPMGEIAAVARWLRWLEGQGRSQRTIGIYRSAVARFLFEYVGSGPQDATEEHVSSFLSDVGGQGPAGRRQAWQALRSAFAYWLRRGMVGDDPTADVVVRKPRKKKQVALTEDELLRFFLAAYVQGGERRAFTFLLGFGLGTRRGELAHIEPSDVVGNAVHLRICKGGKDRWVELSRMARLALDGLKPWNNGTVLGGIKPGTLSYWAQEAARGAGLDRELRGRSLHILRASFATYLLRNGTPVHVVRDLLGHESIATTNDYAVTFEQDRRKAVDQIGGTG